MHHTPTYRRTWKGLAKLRKRLARRQRQRDVQLLLLKLLRPSARLLLPQQQQKRSVFVNRLKKIAENANGKKKSDVRGEKKQMRGSGGNWSKRS